MHSGFGSLLQIRNDEPQRLPLDPGRLRGLDRERPPGRRGRGCKQLQRRVRQRAGEHDDDRDENHEERARPPTLLRFNERLRFWRGRTGWLHPSPPKLFGVMRRPILLCFGSQLETWFLRLRTSSEPITYGYGRCLDRSGMKTSRPPWRRQGSLFEPSLPSATTPSIGPTACKLQTNVG